MFNMDSAKECTNILLVLNPVFNLWEMILIEWERCNILNCNGEVLLILQKQFINIFLPLEPQGKVAQKANEKTNFQNNHIA